MPAQKPIQKITIADGVSVAIDLTSYVELYYVTGTATTTTSWAVTGSGTPYEGMSLKFEYRGTVTLGTSTHLTFLGTQMPDDYVTKKVNIDCYYNGSAWIVDYTPAFDEADIITSTMIKSVDGANLIAGSVAAAAITPFTASKALETSVAGAPQASTTTTTELGYLAGTTPGTVAANKAIVPTTGKIIDEIDVTTLKLGSVAITASAAEINKMDGATCTAAEYNVLAGVTPGTAAASKALVLSASKKIDELDATVLKINGTTVTSSAAELNALNSAGLVKADFDLLYGLAAAGVTAADIQAIKGFATGAKTQRSAKSYNSDQTIAATDSLIVVTLGADLTFTLPDVTVPTYQSIDFIILDNPTTAYDITFAATGANTVSYTASDATSQKVSTPAINARITVANNAAGTWVVGV